MNKRTIRAVGLDVSSNGAAQVITFLITRDESGNLSVEIANRKQISHAKETPRPKPSLVAGDSEKAADAGA